MVSDAICAVLTVIVAGVGDAVAAATKRAMEMDLEKYMMLNGRLYLLKMS